MKVKFLLACALFLFAVASTPAQMKTGTSGTCNKPDVSNSLQPGDMEGHSMMLQQGKCTPKAERHGAKATEAMFYEQDDVHGNRLKGSGVYVETYDNGDKLFYSYQTTGTMKDGVYVTGSNRYQITGGTGKMKGMKESGSCKLKGNADGGLDYNCTSASMSAAEAKPETK